MRFGSANFDFLIFNLLYFIKIFRCITIITRDNIRLNELSLYSLNAKLFIHETQLDDFFSLFPYYKFCVLHVIFFPAQLLLLMKQQQKKSIFHQQPPARELMRSQ